MLESDAKIVAVAMKTRISRYDRIEHVTPADRSTSIMPAVFRGPSEGGERRGQRRDACTDRVDRVKPVSHPSHPFRAN